MVRLLVHQLSALSVTLSRLADRSENSSCHLGKSNAVSPQNCQISCGVISLVLRPLPLFLSGFYSWYVLLRRDVSYAEP